MVHTTPKTPPWYKKLHHDITVTSRGNGGVHFSFENADKYSSRNGGEGEYHRRNRGDSGGESVNGEGVSPQSPLGGPKSSIGGPRSPVRGPMSSFYGSPYRDHDDRVITTETVEEYNVITAFLHHYLTSDTEEEEDGQPVAKEAKVSKEASVQVAASPVQSSNVSEISATPELSVSSDIALQNESSVCSDQDKPASVCSEEGKQSEKIEKKESSCATPKRVTESPEHVGVPKYWQKTVGSPNLGRKLYSCYTPTSPKQSYQRRRSASPSPRNKNANYALPRRKSGPVEHVESDWTPHDYSRQTSDESESYLALHKRSWSRTPERTPGVTPEKSPLHSPVAYAISLFEGQITWKDFEKDDDRDNWPTGKPPSGAKGHSAGSPKTGSPVRSPTRSSSPSVERVEGTTGSENSFHVKTPSLTSEETKSVVSQSDSFERREDQSPEDKDYFLAKETLSEMTASLTSLINRPVFEYDVTEFPIIVDTDDNQIFRSDDKLEDGRDSIPNIKSLRSRFESSDGDSRKSDWRSSTNGDRAPALSSNARTPSRWDKPKGETPAPINRRPEEDSDGGEVHEEELPAPSHTKNMLAKFKAFEGDQTTPVKKTTSLPSRQARPSPDSGIYETDSYTNGHSRPDDDDSPRNRAGEVVTEELPESGFTRNLVAQWRNKEQESGLKTPSPTVATSKSPARSFSNRSVASSQRTMTPDRDVVVSASEVEDVDGSPGSREVVREADRDDESELPPPSFTRNMLAKFQSMQDEAQREATTVKPVSKKAGSGSQQFKWQVKESITLKGPTAPNDFNRRQESVAI